jgi:Zn-dependent protease
MVVFGTSWRVGRIAGIEVRIDSSWAVIALLITYLAWTNLLLAAFNLVPGFPLDGGRLLRSAIWKATGSLARATRIASAAGQGVGWLLVAAGVAWLLAGDLAGGIWFAFIGWFLVQAARSSYQDLQLQQLLRGSRPRR